MTGLCRSGFSRLVSRLDFGPFSLLGFAHRRARMHGRAVFAAAIQTRGPWPTPGWGRTV